MASSGNNGGKSSGVDAHQVQKQNFFSRPMSGTSNGNSNTNSTATKSKSGTTSQMNSSNINNGGKASSSNLAKAAGVSQGLITSGG